VNQSVNHLLWPSEKYKRKRVRALILIQIFHTKKPLLPLLLF
jgi:hypothetical protein